MNIRKDVWKVVSGMLSSMKALSIRNPRCMSDKVHYKNSREVRLVGKRGAILFLEVERRFNTMNTS